MLILLHGQHRLCGVGVGVGAELYVFIQHSEIGGSLLGMLLAEM
jgi:hypothetical protein